MAVDKKKREKEENNVGENNKESIPHNIISRAKDIDFSIVFLQTFRFALSVSLSVSLLNNIDHLNIQLNVATHSSLSIVIMIYSSSSSRY